VVQQDVLAWEFPEDKPWRSPRPCDAWCAPLHAAEPFIRSQPGGATFLAGDFQIGPRVVRDGKVTIHAYRHTFTKAHLFVDTKGRLYRLDPPHDPTLGIGRFVRPRDPAALIAALRLPDVPALKRARMRRLRPDDRNAASA
jgi:hypothetical protein